MAKPRECPHCKHEIPLVSGFHFDGKGNMIHDHCGKVVFSVTEDAEKQLSDKKFKPKATKSYSTTSSWKNQLGYDY